MHMRQEPSIRHEAAEARSAAPSAVFEAVYAAHHRQVLAYCARRASRIDAWDAAAETFAIAWRRIDDVPRGDGTLPWLFATAYRVISNQRRSTRRRNRLNDRIARLPLDGGPFPDAQLIRSEEEAEVVAALERPAQRLIAWFDDDKLRNRIVRLPEQLHPVELVGRLVGSLIAYVQPQHELLGGALTAGAMGQREAVEIALPPGPQACKVRHHRIDPIRPGALQPTRQGCDIHGA